MSARILGISVIVCLLIGAGCSKMIPVSQPFMEKIREGDRIRAAFGDGTILEADVGKIQGEVLPWKASIVKTKSTWPLVILVLAVIGSIFAGIATPTEAAAVGAFGATILACVYRKFNWQVLKRTTFSTLTITCQLMFINIGVKIMQAAFGRSGLIAYTTESLVGLTVPPIVILIMIFILFLILGCVLQDIAVLLMVVPVVFPTVMALGYDPIWFGVVVTLLCLASLLTPPVGIVLFALQALRPEKPVTEIYKGVLPFVVTVMVMLVIIVAYPNLALWFPSVIFGG